MRKIALRGLLARKLRLALTALAVALGVTLIAGTYIFTDTITKSFDNIFVQTNRGTDVAISPNDDLSGDEDPPPIPARVLQQVKQVDGVDTAEGAVFSQGGSFRKADGSKLKGQGFNAIAGAHDVQRFESFAPTQGHLPRTADEVAIPKGTADNNNFKVGDKLQIQDAAAKKTYTISGIVTIAGTDSLGGGVIMQYALDHPTLSLTLVSTVSPYGFGGTRRDGSRLTDDDAGCGGGAGNPDFVERLTANDTSDEAPTSPRNVFRSGYVAPGFTTEHEDVLVESILSTSTATGTCSSSTASRSW